jgi:glycosyltransferase involved in cell wall biosynthesis
MTKTPAVSVIMTVYNGQAYLAQAIESIRRQSLSDFELVIVDDGSDDRTPEILAQAQADDLRIKVISKPRVGRARALNVAWRQARGTYIANLDADDLAEPTRLEKQVAFLQQHPEVGLLGTACKYVRENTGQERLARRPLTDAELRAALVQYDPFVHSSVMMPRQVLEEIGGYNENFKVGIDYELWVRIACHYRLANLPEVLAVRRLDGDNYFLHRVSSWERCQSKMMIRWYAWRKFSGKTKDLYYVLLEPLAKWMNGWSGGRLSASRTGSLRTARSD